MKWFKEYDNMKHGIVHIYLKTGNNISFDALAYKSSMIQSLEESQEQVIIKDMTRTYIILKEQIEYVMFYELGEQKMKELYEQLKQ